MPVVLGLFVSIIWRLRVRVKSWSYWIHRVLAFSLIEVYLIALCVFILTSNANHNRTSSQMSGMRKESTVDARAPISREFSKENGKTRNFKGKHKNQLLCCKISEGIKFMTICKRKQKYKKRKTGDLSDSKIIQVQVPCNLVPRVSHLPAPWSSRGREDERPWERGCRVPVLE